MKMKIAIIMLLLLIIIILIIGFNYMVNSFFDKWAADMGIYIGISNESRVVQPLTVNVKSVECVAIHSIQTLSTLPEQKVN